MTNNIIRELIKEHPEIEHFKKGFPNIGKRADNKPFGAAVKEIETAWKFYDTDLYGVTSEQEIIKLGSGNPINYKAFPTSIKYIKKELKKNLFEYPPAAGEEMHRETIAKYLIKEGYPEYLNYNNVIVTNSTTNGFYLTLKSLFKPYDCIIMTAPNYGLFAFMPERLNISVELVELKKENAYLINPKDLEKKISEINKKLKEKYKDSLGYTPKVRAFLNINPHNPLGTVLSVRETELLSQIGEICMKNNIFIIDDLVYRDLTYDHTNIAKPIGTIARYFDNTISLFGLSKSYGLAASRAGFLVANENVIRLLRDNLFYTMDSASVLQSALLAGTYNTTKEREKFYKRYFQKIIPDYLLNCYLCIALFDGIASVKDTPYYKKIVKLITKQIKDKKLQEQILKGVPYAKTVITPASGFFLLIDFTAIKTTGIINSEKELLEYLYRKCGVKFLVGQSFSWPTKNALIARITYSFKPNILIDAISKINIAINGGIYETNRNNDSC